MGFRTWKPFSVSPIDMKQLDEMDRKEEAALVSAALSDKATRRRLTKQSRALVNRLAALYAEEGIDRSPRQMTEAAMRQLTPILNAYGQKMTKRGKKPERFALVLAWWSTRRMEQLLRD